MRDSVINELLSLAVNLEQNNISKAAAADWARKLSERLGHPMDKGPWEVPNETGEAIWSDDFDHDVTILIKGDFADQEQRLEYANHLCRLLNEIATGD